MLVSFYILAYNHEHLIAAAIDGALAQTYSPLEIIISDDCSTDSTWAIITEKAMAYGGPHKIIARRNQKNMGISAHINEVWRCCSGEWVVASAGDDVSEPNRVAKIAEAVKKNPSVKLIQSFLNEIDERGCLLEVNHLGTKNTSEAKHFGLIERINGFTYAPHGAAMAYSREIFDIFGPMPSGVIFEDNIVNLRAELIDRAMVLPTPLVNHRNHLGQITRINPKSDPGAQHKSIKRRLDSDVLSSAQNIMDLKTARDKGLKLPYTETKDYLEDRLKYFERKRKALLWPWPMRLLYFFRIIWRRDQVARFSRSDMFYSLLPRLIYRLAKRL